MSDQHHSILMGGLVVGILSTSYLGILNMLCCLGVMIGGAVGVWHFTSEHRTTLASGEGAQLGAASGLVGLLLSLVLNFLFMKVGLGAEQAVSGLMQSGFSDMMTEEQIEMMREQLEAARNRSFFESVVNFGTIVNLFVFPLFGAVGGAAGASLFRYGDEHGGPESGEAEYEIIDE